MDRGEVFKNLICIYPGEDGSFVVHAGEQESRRQPTYGFTNLSDLLNWLVANAQAAAAVKVDQLTEAQIVPNPGLMARIGGQGQDPVRRTTAAEIIREREEREARGVAAQQFAAGCIEPPRSA